MPVLVSAYCTSQRFGHTLSDLIQQQLDEINFVTQACGPFMYLLYSDQVC